ncbi:MAG: cyclic nucleotide-binding domain-containing protein [Elusimicrobiota bacterium]
MKKLNIDSKELGVLASMMRKVEFFTPLTIGQLDKILPTIMLYHYDKGETVFSQGQKGDAFYIIYQGAVEIRLNRWLVMSKTVASLKPGDFLGEIALISDEPRTATVVCAEPAKIFVLTAEDFRFVLNENPAAASEMRRIAARRKFDTSHQSDS